MTNALKWVSKLQTQAWEKDSTQDFRMFWSFFICSLPIGKIKYLLRCKTMVNSSDNNYLVNRSENQSYDFTMTVQYFHFVYIFLVSKSDSWNWRDTESQHTWYFTEDLPLTKNYFICFAYGCIFTFIHFTLSKKKKKQYWACVFGFPFIIISCVCD